MTTRTDFDRVVADWLAGTAGEGTPDYLDETLGLASSVRQRPWWSSPERWLPMDIAARASSLAPPRLGRVILVVLLVVVLLALGILVVGSRQQRLPPPFGPARNGTITFAASGDIYGLDSLDGTPRLLIGGASDEFAPGFWRDGTHIGFLRDTHRSGAGVALMVANADGSNVRELVDLADAPSWADTSPDGSTIAFAGVYHGVGGIYLLKTDGPADPRRLDLGDHQVGWPIWRPPDGHELLYIESLAAGDVVYPRLDAVRPDGTGRRLIKDLEVMDGNSVFNLDPSVTPDGRSFVYAVADSDHLHNHLIDLQTGVDRQLTLGPPGTHELHGMVSPDGTKLLFHDAALDASQIQEMVAPLDGSTPAIAIGPAYPVVNGSADLSQEFSPDGQTIVIYQGRDRLIRIVDATTGGIGRSVSWQPDDLPGWQRLAP